MISASLERRVWMQDDPMQLYSNLYVANIAEPGGGKSMPGNWIGRMFDSFESIDPKTGVLVEAINRGPNKLTIQALIKNLHKNYKTICTKDDQGNDKHYTYSNISFITTGELGNLLASDAEDLATFLNEGWDAPKTFKKETMSGGLDIVKNMCVGMLGSGTPDWLQSVVSSSIFNQGLGARFIFLYGDETDKRCKTHLYTWDEERERDWKDLREHISGLFKICNQMEVPKDTSDWLDDWYCNKNVPLNNDQRLKHYYARKKVHLMKLAMVMHYAESLDRTLTVDDFERALQLLNATEINMARAITGTGINPTAKIAAGIEMYLKQFKHAGFEELLVQFFEQIPYGDQRYMQNAIDYLLRIRRITKTDPITKKGDTIYSYNNGLAKMTEAVMTDNNNEIIRKMTL